MARKRVSRELLTRSEGRRIDAPHHQPMLAVPQAVVIADILAIEAAMDAGLSQEDAVEMCAGPELKRRI